MRVTPRIWIGLLIWIGYVIVIVSVSLLSGVPFPEVGVAATPGW